VQVCSWRSTELWRNRVALGLTRSCSTTSILFISYELVARKLDEKAKAKRKRFDEKSARLSNRSAAVSQFSNADGSSTAIIGKGGTSLDEKGKAIDSDSSLVKEVKDAKNRFKKSVGVVRASVPESLVDDGEALSIGVPGARIGIGVRKAETAKGKAIPAVVKASDLSVADVFGPGTSLRYAIGEGGVKEEIALNAVPAAGEVVYRFPLTLDGYGCVFTGPLAAACAVVVP
jgi:hypothetical protein